jgi:short-subunit dehydrogenase
MKKGEGTALITGASAGIGAALAREFAANGHDVILVARSADKLEKLAGELEHAHRVKAVVITSDLSVPGAAEGLYREVRARKLFVDILVNNAGLLFEGPFWKTKLANHEQLVQVNITALTALTHLFLSAMIKRGRGRVMNVASTSAFSPVPYLSTYAASKAYVLSMSEALNIELRAQNVNGVKVIALCPGFTETDMIAKEGGRSMNVPLVRNMSAAEVAAEGYAACKAGRPLFINGIGNRALVQFGKHQPRWLQRRLYSLIARKGINS